MSRHNGGVIGPFIQTSPTSAPGVWTANDAAARLSAGSAIDGWPGPADPDFASVKFLTHFDPYPGKGAFYDVTGTLGVTGYAGVNTTTATKKFGTHSLRTTAGAYIRADGIAMGAGDFCIEGWLNLNSLPTDAAIFDGRPPTTNGVFPLIHVDSSGAMYYYVDSADRITSSAGVVTTGSFKHFAVDRASGVTQLFYDGSKVGSDYSDGNNYSLAGGFYFGNNSFQTAGISGYYDEIRITIGASRYRGPTYTVPTAPFPDY